MMVTALFWTNYAQKDVKKISISQNTFFLHTDHGLTNKKKAKMPFTFVSCRWQTTWNSWPILHFGFFLPQKLKIKIHLQLEISSRQLIAQINNESLKLLETQFAAMLKSLMLFCETHACLPCFVKNISLEGGRRKVESDTKMFDGMQLWRWCKVLIQWL